MEKFLRELIRVQLDIYCGDDADIIWRSLSMCLALIMYGEISCSGQPKRLGPVKLQVQTLEGQMMASA